MWKNGDDLFGHLAEGMGDGGCSKYRVARETASWFHMRVSCLWPPKGEEGEVSRNTFARRGNILYVLLDRFQFHAQGYFSKHWHFES